MNGHRGALLAVLMATAAVAAGCASERYVRETTQILSEDVVLLRRDLARYTEGQARNTARRINAVLRQREQREEVEAIVQARLREPAGAGPLHRDLLAHARERVAAERARAEARAAERAALEKTQARLDAELDRQLDELIDQLKELSSSPSFKDRAAFFAEYFKRTRKAVDAAQEGEGPP